jgi:L-lactate dehydrogenase complex protein LldF
VEVKSLQFRARAAERLADPALQSKLGGAKQLFVGGRARVVAEFDSVGQAGDFETLRGIGAEIRDTALTDLDAWLEAFEAKATATGATVLWARDGREAQQLIVDIAKRHGVKKVIKSKSMLSEEAGLNEGLEAAGVQSVETDLGEYILQLAKEPPSHILAPAIHKNKEEVDELFARCHGRPVTPEGQIDIPALTREARVALREHFLSADMGITGGNFLVAETGSVALVTNEGNGRMVTTLPRVHVAVVGIEKVIPTLEDLSALLRLLTRSATGQTISNYVSLLTGPRAEGAVEGPEHMYFVLMDNGRAGLVGGDFQEMLRCIRCGACMNHCPVYQSIGGHAYGWVYPGPMGSVLTPLYTGLEQAPDLPQAATLCGQCSIVCPVKIPLPELLRKLREKQMETELRPWQERWALRTWGFFAARPRLYALAAGLGARALKLLAGGKASIRTLPGVPEWSRGRDFPAPQGKTFRELYAAHRQQD